MARTTKLLALTLAQLLQSLNGHARQTPPIIDMHLHASDGNPPWAVCVPWVTQVPAWDPNRTWEEVWNEAVTNPPCPNPIWPPKGEEAVMRQTIAVLERRNIVGVLSGPPERVLRWRDAAPDRFIPAVEFQLGRDAISVDALRGMFERRSFAVLGEVTNQYLGIAPDDKRMEPYWALAERLDVPVAIHLGEGILGTAYIGRPEYRARLTSPFLLEEVLIRHPRLRVSVMHYASPLINELIAMLGAYPQLYVDIGGIQWFYPRAYFYAQLRQLVDAGFGKRVMFGSDQGAWPGIIEPAIAIIEQAPFLSEQEKRDIFYNNAARFLRLSAADIAKHHGK
jgi:predicted TIM-barrel fold metal-dependent hydrolase